MAKQYDTPLRLTSPHMTGQPVKDAQWLMQGHNRYPGLAPYKDGDLDGDYGPLTAQATRRTKFWLGYPEKGLDSSFGQILYEYLLPDGRRDLPPDYVARRNARIAAGAAANKGEAAYQEAERYIGYAETPVNRTMFGKWYGWDGVPWCAIFESYCFAHSSMPEKSYRYAAVESIYHDAAGNRNGLYIVRTPRLGDIVGYMFHGDRFAHTGFYGQKLTTAEFEDLSGNTHSSNMANGGMVLKQKRTTNQVTFYARVG